MAGKWTSLGLDTSTVQETLRDIADGLDQIVTLLEAVKGVVDAISSLIISFESAIKAILSSIITLIEQTLLNALETNVYLCIHSNLGYDPEWSFKPKRRLLSDGSVESNRNFEDGDWLLRGSGMSGWMGEVMASTHDDSDPFRPITDNLTSVTGLIFVVAGPTFSELQDIYPLFETLFKFRNDTKTEEDAETEPKQKFKQAIAGYWGSRTEKLSDGMTEASAAVDEMISSLDGLYSDAMPKKNEIFLNSSGPSWVSAPLAGILGEPIKQMSRTLRAFINSFTFADSPIIALLNALSNKIETLARIVEKLSDVIDSLAALFELLEIGHIYCGSESSGGTQAFFSNAAIAEGVPNVGANGFVIGVSAINTVPSADSFLSLLNIFGANAEAAFAATSDQADAVGAAVGGVEDAFSSVEFEGE